MHTHTFSKFFAAVFLFGLMGCSNNSTEKKTTDASVDTTQTVKDTSSAITQSEPNNAATILQMKQVPVLCYHHIDERVPAGEAYSVTISEFASHLKMLHDSGYQTILPQQYYDYLVYNKTLPAKPVMLSFDDTREEHYRIAGKEMRIYGFKGVFFIMNIAIGKPDYMSAEQIKLLSDSGHVIGSHTWDHQNAKNVHGDDWIKQLDEPKAKLESITDKQVDFFAYPFGVWTDSAAMQIKNRGIKAAFILTQKRSETQPLHTIRRMIVPSGWNGVKLKKFMDMQFE